MDLCFDELKKRFPNLEKERKQRNIRVRISSIRSENKNNSGPKTLSGYIPDVVDFLRRCNNAEEAGKIIDFLESRGEISHEYAIRLHTQLRMRGLKSFGPKKNYGYYLRHGEV